MKPLGSWAERRLASLKEYDLIRIPSRVGSPFGKNVSNWKGKTHVYPTNVLVLATESRNRGHSAAFPISLPEHFIKLFTAPGDLVLDPFLGSGTTAIAALKNDRRYLGMEVSRKYFLLASRSIEVAVRNGSALESRMPKGSDGKAKGGLVAASRVRKVRKTPTTKSSPR